MRINSIRHAHANGANRKAVLSRIRSICIVAIGTLCLSAALTGKAQAVPTNYYVNVATGDDSRTATQAQNSATPWKTIQHASTTVTAGTTGAIINIAAGNYTPATEGAPQIYLYNTGTATAPITYQGAPSDGTSITCRIEAGGFWEGWHEPKLKYVNLYNLYVHDTGANYQGIILEGCSNINIRWCHTYHTGQTGIAIWGADWWDPNPGMNPSLFPSQQIWIDNCVVDSACYPHGSNEAIDIANGVSYAWVTFCHVYDSLNDGNPADNWGYDLGGEGIDVKMAADHVYVSGCEVNGLYRIGIYADGGGQRDGSPTYGLSNVYAYDNKVLNQHNGDAIEIDSEEDGPLENVEVYNNLVYNNSKNGIVLQSYPGSTAVHDNIWIVNNTLWNNGLVGTDGGIYAWDAYATNNIFVNNNIVANCAGWGVQGNNNFAMDYNLSTKGINYSNGSYTHNQANAATPSFVNTATADFHLTSAASNVIGLGSPSGLGSTTAVDYDAKPRPTPAGAGSGYDIGAYQYQYPRLAVGTYKICPMSLTSQTLNAPGSAFANGTTLILWNYVSGANNEKWKVVDNGDGTYQIQTVLSLSQVLNNYGGNGAGAAGLWSNSPLADNEKFYIVPTSGGYYKILPKTNVALGLTTTATANSSPVTFATYTGTTGQQWLFGTP